MTTRPAVFPLIAAAVLWACGTSEQKPAADTAAATPAGAERIFEAGGMKTPESVRYDAAQDLWFVSNINGNPSQKDGNGFIVRLTADGAAMDSTPFIEGGKKGVTLHAPKGLAIVGDTIWVADIDAVRAFNTKTGTPVASVDIKGSTFLNDVAAGPDGSIYITDTGIRFDEKGQLSHPGPDRVVQVIGRQFKQVTAFAGQQGPNGIAYDSAGGRFLINAFTTKGFFAWKVGQATPDSIGLGAGDADGLEILADGRAVYTSWVDSSLSVFANGTSSTLMKGLPNPADIGVDAKRQRVAVPLFNDGKVVFVKLGSTP
ncbi:MAG: SMP-30/gluconolactonase/LRE family protein [Gemmatimonadota bacterium]|nr:SMP-30/gluconolactonase/LRE family protein [Gemmatimonadota bacterium]